MLKISMSILRESLTSEDLRLKEGSDSIDESKV